MTGRGRRMRRPPRPRMRGRGGPACGPTNRSRGGRRLLRLGFDLGWLRALPRPWLVELHAPLTLLGLHQRQAGTEGAAGATLEPCDRFIGAPRPDQLTGDRNRKLLARFGLPDHESAAGV